MPQSIFPNQPAVEPVNHSTVPLGALANQNSGGANGSTGTIVQENDGRKRARWGCYCLGALVLVVGLAILLTLSAGMVGLLAGAWGDLESTKDFSQSGHFQTYLVDDPQKGYARGKESPESGLERDLIVVLPLQGMIVSGDWTSSGESGFITPQRVSYALKYIASQKRVKGVILEINSPGGGVAPSDSIYHELELFKKESKLPLVALFDDMACSGGYYIAMAAQEIVAQPSSWTGSIGVIMQTPELVGLMGKVGVDMNTITSGNVNGGPSFKDIGSSFREMRPAERQLLQNLVTQSWQRFTEVVAQGRKGKLTLPQVRKLADGRIFNSQQALKHKLIDRIGYRQEAYALARQLAKSPQAQIVYLSSQASLWQGLSYQASNWANLWQLWRRGQLPLSLPPANPYQPSLQALERSPQPYYLAPLPSQP